MTFVSYIVANKGAADARRTRWCFIVIIASTVFVWVVLVVLLTATLIDVPRSTAHGPPVGTLSLAVISATKISATPVLKDISARAIQREQPTKKEETNRRYGK